VPRPSAAFSLNGPRPIAFQVAIADYAQTGFDAENVLNKKPGDKGWSVGGQSDQPHGLTLIAAPPVPVPAGSRLTVTIEQSSGKAKHSLTRFRLSATDDTRAADWTRTPPAVLEALQTPTPRRTPQQEAIAKHYRTLAPELQPIRQRLGDLNKQLAEL